MSNSNARRDCVDDALFRIFKLKKANQPVWLSGTVAELLRDHPECGMSKVELTETVSRLVIERGGSIGEDSERAGKPPSRPAQVRRTRQ